MAGNLHRGPQAYAARLARRWWLGGGDAPPAHEPPHQNHRLTALAGLVLIPPLLLVLATGALFDPLWRAHYFVGIGLLPIAAIKLATTGYRAASYYLGKRAYREAGPPVLPMRLLAPVLIASLLVVSVTGVEMWLAHSQDQPWSTLHSAAAFIFTATAAVHLLVYLPSALGTTARARQAAGTSSDGRGARRAAVAGSIAFGLVLGAAVALTASFPTRSQFPGDRGPQAHAPAVR